MGFYSFRKLQNDDIIFEQRRYINTIESEVLNCKLYAYAIEVNIYMVRIFKMVLQAI